MKATRMDVCSWHVASFCCAAKFVAYWTNNGQRVAQGLNRYAANDPKRTWRVRRSTNAAPVNKSRTLCNALDKRQVERVAFKSLRRPSPLRHRRDGISK